MNEREFHGLVREWLRAEAPREAPDWIIDAALDRTSDGLRRPASRRPLGWRAALGLLAVVALVVAGLAAMWAFGPRPVGPPPSPEAPLLIPLEPGNVLGAVLLPDGIWLASSTLPGAIRLDHESGDTRAQLGTDRPASARHGRRPRITDVLDGL
jgi:hypothetical protein